MHLEKVEYLGPKYQLNPKFLTLMGVLLHLPQVSRSFRISVFCFFKIVLKLSASKEISGLVSLAVQDS